MRTIATLLVAAAVAGCGETDAERKKREAEERAAELYRHIEEELDDLATEVDDLNNGDCGFARKDDDGRMWENNCGGWKLAGENEQPDQRADLPTIPHDALLNRAHPGKPAHKRHEP